MPGGADPDNRRDFPGGFPGDPHNAFTAAARTPEQQDVFAHVQALLSLRRAHPALCTGKQWHIGWDDTYYAFVRELPEEKVLVVYNNASTSRDLAIPVDDTPLQATRELQPLFGDAHATIQDHELRLTVPSRSVAILLAHE